MQNDYKPMDFGICGVYEIKCIPNEKCYIGSSRNIHVRINSHRIALNALRHKNAGLQECWIKYSASSFVWRVLEYCSESERLQCEKKIIEEYPEELLFNILLTLGIKTYERKPKYPPSPEGIGALNWHMLQAAISEWIKDKTPITRQLVIKALGVSEGTVANRNWLGIIYDAYPNQFEWEDDPAYELEGKRGRKVQQLRPK